VRSLLTACARAARCAETISATRDDVVTWVTARRGERLLRRFASHLDALETVLLEVLDRIGAAQKEQESNAGAEYACCRKIERWKQEIGLCCGCVSRERKPPRR